ncbi:uncharacterized protein LOC128395720 [Panonychus citri]|uniref:uncharacterized protein LOC128395720 n=1 Tax=Panonychus citri TaxID=50023 RepID=UPI00230833DC|nr:uncharacterized protein LOC128395720 [Panonychus citri]XP_053212171.1 uncharacterized protein LOC128395720 [Panonychus citri]
MSSSQQQLFGKMIVNLSLVATLSLIVSLIGLTGAVSSQDSVKASSANLTAYNTPYAYYDYERDPRRWFGNGQFAPGASYAGPLAQFPGGLEAIAIGLMMAVGAGFIVIPLMIILYMIFVSPNGNPNLNGGFNFSQLPTTTTIGRKRREAGGKSAEALVGGLPEMMSPFVQEKLLSFFKKFANAPDRMEYIKNMLKP